MPEICDTKLDQNWTLMEEIAPEDDIEEQFFARYNRVGNKIEIVNLIGLRGWELEKDDPDYNKFVVDVSAYECERLTLDDPEVDESTEDLLDRGTLRAEDLALALFQHGYTDRFYEGRTKDDLPLYDSYEEAFDKYIGKHL